MITRVLNVIEKALYGLVEEQQATTNTLCSLQKCFENQWKIIPKRSKEKDKKIEVEEVEKIARESD